MRKIHLVLICCLLLATYLIGNAGINVSAQSETDLQISEIGHLDTSGWAANVRVEDNIAFIADSDSGLYLIDVSNPESPIELSQFNDGIDHLHELYVFDDLAYVADYTEGFKIIDVSNPESPTQIGMCHDGGEVGTFDIMDDLVFIADFEDGLEIVNISDPSDPTEIVQYNTGISYIFNVEVNDDLAYVSEFISATQKSLIILNISDIYNIEELAEYPIDGEVFSIEFDGDIAYMMCSYGGVKVFNISDPLSLTEIGSYYDGGNAVDLEFYGNYPIIADRDDGLEILNFNDLSNITEIVSYFESGSASGLAIVDDLIFVANGEDGLRILQIEIVPTTTPGNNSQGFNLLIVGIGGIALAGVIIAVVIRRMR